MTQPRFRPRYAIKGQGLQDLYDVFDYEDCCIVSDKPKPHDEALADAKVKNAFTDARKLDDVIICAGYTPFAPPDSEALQHWLCGLNFAPRFITIEALLQASPGRPDDIEVSP